MLAYALDVDASSVEERGGEPCSSTFRAVGSGISS